MMRLRNDAHDVNDFDYNGEAIYKRSIIHRLSTDKAGARSRAPAEESSQTAESVHDRLVIVLNDGDGDDGDKKGDDGDKHTDPDACTPS